MLLVTHDLREAFQLADEVAVMRAGRIEQIASASELRESPANVELFRRIATEVVAVAASQGVTLPVETPDRVVEGFRRLPGDARHPLERAG